MCLAHGGLNESKLDEGYIHVRVKISIRENGSVEAFTINVVVVEQVIAEECYGESSQFRAL